MTASRLFLVLGAVVSVVLLTACAEQTPQPGALQSTSASSSGSPGANPTESATSAVSEAPSSTATPTPPPEVAVITTAGWGDLKLGKPVPTSTTLVTWKTVEPDECMGNAGYWDLPEDPGAVLVRTEGNSRAGAIEGISLLDPSVTTKSGAHVGMNLADLRRLFPAATVNSDGSLYVVSDSLGQVVFDVGDKNADDYYPGPAATDVVLVIHVLPTSTKPFSNQNTEFGPCA